MIDILKIILIPLIVLNLIPVLIWMERKGAAYIQDRRGPNRANILGIRLGGLIHNIADVIKLLSKEDFVPAGVHRLYFILAPAILMFVSFVTVAVIPLADTLQWGGRSVSLQVADLNVGLLYILSISSLSVYSMLLAGWASNSKYAFLGGLRACSQMISYEITLGLSLVAVMMLSQSVSLNEIILNQGNAPWGWNAVRQPLAFLLFLVASYAETNRTPFDLPEGESEIVGFHVEYSSMKFALFFMGEYAAMVIVSALTAALFFGGWQVPFLSTEALKTGAPALFYQGLLIFSVVSLVGGFLLLKKYKKGKGFLYRDRRDFEPLFFGGLAVGIGLLVGLVTLFFSPGTRLLAAGSLGAALFAAVVQFASFILKTLFFCFLFVWVRWTLPRFRYDQLMRFGWKMTLPLALLNVMITGFVLLWK